MAMTPRQFIESLAEAYQKARVPLKEHKKLSRGESRSIASEAEDRFAYYLIGRLRSADHIFINQTLTSVSWGREERLKPDLVICRGDEIRMLIDLKMDLGYKRFEFSDSMREVDKRVGKLRGQKFSLWEKIGDGRDRHEKTLSKNAKYLFVVISDQNINANQFKDVETSASKLGNTGLFTLLRGIHLNHNSLYGRNLDDVMAEVSGHICHEAFRNLEALLIEALA